MSFLLRTTLRQTATVTSRQCSRSLTTTPLARKTAVDAAKETIQKVDRTVSDAAVKGIEKGEQAAATLKSSASSSTSEARGKASEMAGEAKGKAGEMSGEGKGMMSEAKGKMSELKGEAKGKAEEMKGKMS